MRKVITPVQHPIQSVLTLPGSKSLTNRFLLLSAIAKGETRINHLLISDDTQACLQALRNLGVEIYVNEAQHYAEIKGCRGRFPNKTAQIDCREAGTVARFLPALCAASGGDYRFTGAKRLCERPMLPLIQALHDQGVSCDADSLPLRMHSQGLAGGELFVSAELSSQFISALMMAAVYAKTDTTLIFPNTVRLPYIQMTMRCLQQFGVAIGIEEDSVFKRLKIHNQLQYISPGQIEIEPDLSTASYFFAAAAITGGEITIKHIQLQQSTQGDKRFLQILQQMGCQVTQLKEGVKLQGCKTLQGVNVDMHDCSDTFMTLVAVAIFAKTPTTISGIAHTRYQESDRIHAVECALTQLGIHFESFADGLTVFPGQVRSAEINSFNDHRVAMAFSLVGLKVAGIVINQAQCVAKTCPDFFAYWEQLSF